MLISGFDISAQNASLKIISRKLERLFVNSVLKISSKFDINKTAVKNSVCAENDLFWTSFARELIRLLPQTRQSFIAEHLSEIRLHKKFT